MKAFATTVACAVGLAAAKPGSFLQANVAQHDHHSDDGACYVVTSWYPEECGEGTSDQCAQDWGHYPSFDDCCSQNFANGCQNNPDREVKDECYIVTSWNPETCGHITGDAATCERGWEVYDTEEACCEGSFSHACGESAPAPTQPPSEAPTQPPREVPTKPPREVPTKPPREVPTKPATEAPTQPPVAETDPKTRPEGEVPDEIPDDVPNSPVPKGLGEVLYNTNWDNILIYMDAFSKWHRSNVYKEKDLIKATYLMGIKGIGEMELFLGDASGDPAKEHNY
eukprot:Selendium_serpulae@DN5571_c0_g1_i1.p1